jgi:4-amino-4-deoxy-L-arabinose transferase-like glycosyltransferase
VKIADERITKYGLALLAIVLIGLFLRVYQVGTQSIWYDEAWSILASKLAVPQIMVEITAGDVEPPLYYFLLHYWMMVFGTSASAVRLLSVLFGVLAIPMIYVVGRQLFNKEVGLVGALVLALSSFNIWYSQETRMYSLMVLLALLSMYFFLRLLRRRLLQRNNLALSAGYVFFTALLVYTHYYGWFVVIAQNIYVLTLWLLSRERAFKLRHWIGLQAIVAALYVPWIPVLSSQSAGVALHAWLYWIPQPTAATLIFTYQLYSGTAGLVADSGTVVLLAAVLSALFLGLSVFSLFAYQKVRGAMDWKAPLKSLESYAWEVRIQDLTPVYFLAVWLLAIYLIPFAISEIWSPIYWYRYTIAASVALYLLVGKGIANINNKPTKLAVIGVVAALSVASLPSYYFGVTRDQTREATSLIDANAKSGDVVLIYPDFENLPFDYYNNRTDVAVKLISYGNGSVNNPEAITEALQSDVNGHGRVWFYDGASGTPIENFTLNFLNESYAQIYVKSYYTYNENLDIRRDHSVYLYEKRA